MNEQKHNRFIIIMQPHLLVYETDRNENNLFGTVKMTTLMPTKSICTQMKWQKSQTMSKKKTTTRTKSSPNVQTTITICSTNTEPNAIGIRINRVIRRKTDTRILSINNKMRHKQQNTLKKMHKIKGNDKTSINKISQ